MYCSHRVRVLLFYRNSVYAYFSVIRRGSVLDHIWTWRPQPALLMESALSPILSLVRSASPTMFLPSRMLLGVCTLPMTRSFRLSASICHLLCALPFTTLLTTTNGQQLVGPMVASITSLRLGMPSLVLSMLVGLPAEAHGILQ